MQLFIYPTQVVVDHAVIGCHAGMGDAGDLFQLRLDLRQELVKGFRQAHGILPITEWG
jgi:hypothetical protein